MKCLRGEERIERVANGLLSIASSSICHCIPVADTEDAIAKVRAPAVPVCSSLSKNTVLRAVGVNVQLVLALTKSAQPLFFSSTECLAVLSAWVGYCAKQSVHRGRSGVALLLWVWKLCVSHGCVTTMNNSQQNSAAATMHLLE